MASPSVRSAWIAGFERQLQRRKHVLLYGNVHDYVLWRNAYQSLPELLRTFFVDNGFDIVLQYDPLDGMVFADELSPRGLSGTLASNSNGTTLRHMRSQYTTIIRDTMAKRIPELRETSEAEGPAPPVLAPSSLPLQAPSRGLPGMPAATLPRQRATPPEEALAEMRLVLGQNACSLAAVVQLGDMLTTEASRYAADERGPLATLKKCTLESAIIPRGKAAGYRNSLIVVASDLKRVPDWFYLENPFIGVVHVDQPSRDERKFFGMKFGGLQGTDGFFHASSNDPQAENESQRNLEAFAEEFADLTQGMQTADLEALRLTSHTARMPVRPKQVKRLVDYYKFGIQDDPWAKLDAARIRGARGFLMSKVIGQEKAVLAVEDMLIASKVGVAMAPQGSVDRPKGVFFFVGPTGVGKTELAKSVTELVFNDAKAFARFDMSEYGEEHAAEKLAGAPPGFVGYDEGGQLTNRVMQQPHSILLFDEIEKAHPKVMYKFLQILEDGRLTDGRGQTAYFNQTAIIFTSNIGASKLMSRVLGQQQVDMRYDEVSAHFKDEVSRHFSDRMEILNRLGDSIVVFDILRTDYIPAITRKFMDLMSASAKEALAIDLTFRADIESRIKEEMSNGDNILFGGRRIKTLLGTYVERPFNRWVFNHGNPEDLAGSRLELGLSQNLTLEVCHV